MERAVFGTIDSWLVFKLTGRHVTDYTNASRTLLFDIRKLAWDPELCELLGVDPAKLPEARPSAEVYGTTTEFGGEVPVAGIAGDQQAALFGQACHHAGMAKNTYGTGSFVLLNIGTEVPEPREGILTTVAWGLESETDYALEAAVFVTGAAVQWLRDELGVIGDAAETEALAAGLDSNDGVYFVPALTGLGSPHWDPYARGAIVGLTRGTGRAQIARAALEAIAYQTVDAVRAEEAASRRAPRGAQGRRRRGREPLADAVPGRRPRRPGDRARDLGDDGARRRLPRGHRDGALGAGARSRRCGASRSATSPRWATTSASRCSPTGLARSSAPATGPDWTDPWSA